jgi:MYXO-CTERM domain-containing protein
VTCGNPDGCGGTCGCNGGTCVDGTCQGGCGAITFEGCCEGTVTKWCDGSGNIVEQDCADNATAPLCGWLPDQNFYFCTTTTDVDPSGQFPYLCPGACTPACEGRPCGVSDGCHGYCGCAVGETCEAGQCVACTPNCVGRTCGDDGCGGSCGACEAGLTCHEYGVCVDPCQGIGYEGCCQDEQVLWCSGGALATIDCADKPQCGWLDTGYYECGTEGAADPSGAFPKECPSTCVPDCRDRECGHDGCGGSCGACGEDQLCQEGLCEAPPSPDTAEVVDATTEVAADVAADLRPGDVAVDTAADTTAAEVGPDRASGDTPAIDVPAADTATEPDPGGGRTSGGGGGCATGGAQPSLLGLLAGLVALLMLVRRRRAL